MFPFINFLLPDDVVLCCWEELGLFEDSLVVVDFVPGFLLLLLSEDAEAVVPLTRQLPTSLEAGDIDIAEFGLTWPLAPSESCKFRNMVISIFFLTFLSKLIYIVDRYLISDITKPGVV